MPPSVTVVCEVVRTWTTGPRLSDEDAANAVELPASAIMAAAATGRMIRTKRRMVISTWIGLRMGVDGSRDVAKSADGVLGRTMGMSTMPSATIVESAHGRMSVRPR